MMHRSIPGATRPVPHPSQRNVALAAALSLLSMALLAPFAQFGVLASLIVPTDAAATTDNIAASIGLFGAAIAAFLVVAMLDVVVAWGMYVLLRPVNARVALLVAWLRVIYAVAFAYALLNLIAVAQLVNGASAPTLQSDQLHTQVATSVTAFHNGWDLALVIFGLHLIGLGALLCRSVDFPRFIGGLVVLAGIGYFADALGRIRSGLHLDDQHVHVRRRGVADPLAFKLAIKGTRSPESFPTVAETPTVASQAVAS